MSIYAEVLKFKVILNTSLASGVASSSSVSVSLIDSETGKQREIDDEAIIPIIFEKNNEKYESMLMTVNSTTGSLSDVDFVRGIDGDGYLVAGDTDLALQWESGSEGGCKTNSLNSNRTRQIWLGNLRSGGNTTIIGDGTASNQSIKRENDVGEYEWLRFNDTTGKAQFSNDGSSFVNFDNAGVAVLTAARMIDSTALGLGNVQVNDSYATATGIVNTFAVTITGLTSPYTLGEKIRFKANLANTGACTIAVNGGAAKTIKRFNGTTDLSSGDIPINGIVDIVYDGTNYQLVGGAINVTNIVDVTSTAAELNKLTGAGATVTAANLDTVTDSSNADTKHTHAFANKLWVGAASMIVDGTEAKHEIHQPSSLDLLAAAVDLDAGGTPANSQAAFSIVLPAGYTSISSVGLYFVVDGTGTITFDLYSSSAADGANPYQASADSLTTQSADVTTDRIEVFNATAGFNGLDYVAGNQVLCIIKNIGGTATSKLLTGVLFTFA